MTYLEAARICEEYTNLNFKQDLSVISVLNEQLQDGYDFFISKQRKSVLIYPAVKPGSVFNGYYTAHLPKYNSDFEYDPETDEIVGLTKEKLQEMLSLLEKGFKMVQNDLLVKEIEKDFE
jgi:hypothetical protein